MLRVARDSDVHNCRSALVEDSPIRAERAPHNTHRARRSRVPVVPLWDGPYPTYTRRHRGQQDGSAGQIVGRLVPRPSPRIGDRCVGKVLVVAPLGVRITAPERAICAAGRHDLTNAGTAVSIAVAPRVMARFRGHFRGRPPDDGVRGRVAAGCYVCGMHCHRSNADAAASSASRVSHGAIDGCVHPARAESISASARLPLPRRNSVTASS